MGLGLSGLVGSIRFIGRQKYLESVFRERVA